MTRHEKLQEQYEDALFALLMDDFAAAEGKHALEENERLKHDASYAVPQDIHNRCLKHISRCCTKKTLRDSGRIFYRGFTKVAVIAMICTLLFTTAFAASPSFREDVLNFIVKTFEDRTELSFSDLTLSEDDSPKSYRFTVNWLPAGYTLTDQVEDSFRSTNYYRMNSGGEMTISIFLGEGSTLGMDTENAKIEPVVIQGTPGLVSIKDEVVQLAWGNEENAYQVLMIANSTNSETIQDMLKIAENLAVDIN